MKKFLSLVSVCLCVNSVFSQDLKEDLKAMNATYEKLNDFSTEINVRVFAGDNSPNPMVVQKAKICKKGTDYYYRMDDLILLMNDNYTVVINSKQKTIQINNRDKKQEAANLYKLAVPQLDSILKRYSHVKYLGTSQKLKHYEITESKGVIEKTDLYIEENTFLIKKLDYRYNSNFKFQSRAIVEFLNTDLKANLSADDFSEKKYFIKQGKQFIPLIAYQGYKIILPKNNKTN